MTNILYKTRILGTQNYSRLSFAGMILDDMNCYAIFKVFFIWVLVPFAELGENALSSFWLEQIQALPKTDIILGHRPTNVWLYLNLSNMLNSLLKGTFYTVVIRIQIQLSSSSLTAAAFIKHVVGNFRVNFVKREHMFFQRGPLYLIVRLSQKSPELSMLLNK